MALRAEGGAAFAIVHVARVDVVQPGVERNLPRACQRRRQRGGNVVHLVVGMEGGEVQRHVGAQFFYDPPAHRGDFLGRVVFAWNQQRGDFKPDIRFVFEIDERVEHLMQLRQIQDETGNFLAFTPLSFHPEGTYMDDLPAPTGQDDLRNLAVSRLMLDNFQHIKSFWIMNTAQISQLSLWYGADDIDGTIHEYEITYPEGHLGEKQQVLTRRELMKNIREAGRVPMERDSLYGIVPEKDEDYALPKLIELQPA